MRIAVASGKGGTGKTTIAVNLALAAQESVHLLDCDVEEPNCAIFLKPPLSTQRPVHLQIPEIDKDKCTGCGTCSEHCEFNAIVCMKSVPLVFPELCHGCGACVFSCPHNAITEAPHEVGLIQEGVIGDIRLTQGKLHIGQPMAPPIIRQVKKSTRNGAMTILDAPPGTSCPMVATVIDCDFAILVTEPTPFGLNDLELAVETLRELSVPFAVVINRADSGDDRVREYCAGEKIDILVEIPDDRRVAVAYSKGLSICEAIPEYAQTFSQLLQEVKKRAKPR